MVYADCMPLEAHPFGWKIPRLAILKEVASFLYGDTLWTPACTQALQVAFPLRKRAVLRSQKEGVLGKNIAWGGMGFGGGWGCKEKKTLKRRVSLQHAQVGRATVPVTFCIFRAFGYVIIKASHTYGPCCTEHLTPSTEFPSLIAQIAFLMDTQQIP